MVAQIFWLYVAAAGDANSGAAGVLATVVCE